MGVPGKLLTVLLLNSFANICQVLSLRVSPFGVYSDILIKISDQVPRQKCHQALDNLEVSRLTFTSVVVLWKGEMKVFNLAQPIVIRI